MASERPAVRRTIALLDDTPIPRSYNLVSHRQPRPTPVGPSAKRQLKSQCRERPLPGASGEPGGSYLILSSNAGRLETPKCRAAHHRTTGDELHNPNCSSRDTGDNKIVLPKED